MRQVIHNKAPKKAQEVDWLSLPESQSSEIAEIVRTIQNSEQGQNQLQGIFLRQTNLVMLEERC